MEIAKVTFETRTHNVRHERIEVIPFDRLSVRVSTRNRTAELIIPQMEHQLEIRLSSDELIELIKFLGNSFDEIWNPYNSEGQEILKIAVK